jgi:hypothetical protein
MNDNHGKHDPTKAGQQNPADKPNTDPTPGQNAPGQDQPAKTGEPGQDRDTPKQAAPDSGR